ncbi:family 13 putative glycoside hydrolase [Triangularia verruculosa]|uniref:Family 13 putative glycoside hydrolase n=1 Tax=Triangularia verruculosa TaxID=2587418 RepID=A0AAN6XBC3_9PEZI|nr:family 13 putative glycoside hydrolase [Triangularia verruculosa]
MSVSKAETRRQWWKEAVVYQIYPASFRDTNNDGRGDVNGVTEKLDYLKDLGVDVVWLSPIYDSPQVDNGYDIADYKKIYPPYGTLGDVDRLIHELGSRGMKLVMDLVVNHTSDQHPWFLESRSSKTNPKRDWYIWKKPKYDAEGKPGPPNNWNQILGEAHSAWILDEATQEYYFAAFTPQQPDLNWENPDVRVAVHDILRFWLDRGVAGFRMDVINLISKDQSFPDAEVVVPGQPYQPATQYFANGPRLHEFLGELKREVLDKYDQMTVGEMPFVYDETEFLKIVHQMDGYLNMIFHFELVDIDSKRGDVPGDSRMSIGHWDVSDLRRIITRWQRIMLDGGGWNSLYCENHDQPRSVSHFCDDSDEYREYGSKLLALMESTLSGTLFVYQGEELGMRNVPLEWGPEEYKDIESVNYWKKVNEMYPNDQEKLLKARRALQAKARDNGRTPMQWDSSANGGFCPEGVKPWMRVNDDYLTANAAAQTSLKAKSSVYHFWQNLLAIRKENADTFVHGGFELVDETNPDVFSYVREAGSGEKWVVILNFTGRAATLKMPKWARGLQWVVGNYADGPDKAQTSDEYLVPLRPWEGLLARLLCN